MRLLKSAYLQRTYPIYFRVAPDSHPVLERWQGFIPHLAIEIGLYLPPVLQNQTDTENDIRTYCVFKPITHCQRILLVLRMVGVLTSQATSFLYSSMLGVTEGTKCVTSLSVPSDTLREKPHTKRGDASLQFQQQFILVSHLLQTFGPCSFFINRTDVFISISCRCFLYPLEAVFSHLSTLCHNVIILKTLQTGTEHQSATHISYPLLQNHYTKLLLQTAKWKETNTPKNVKWRNNQRQNNIT